MCNVKKFFVNAVLPELFGKFYSPTSQCVKASKEPNEPCSSGTSSNGTSTSCSSGTSTYLLDENEKYEGDSVMPLYFYCQKPDDDICDMVGCDNAVSL